jgi:hypothetical protein
MRRSGSRGTDDGHIALLYGDEVPNNTISLF